MDDFLLARVIDGRYLIRRRLGRGSVGSVFDGEHVQTKRRVAIKVLHYALSSSGELRSRFEREAQSASRLSHPSCVSVLDFGRIAKIEPAGGADEMLGMPYLVMEFVRGELLMAKIQQGPLAAPEALVITRGVLSALRHAHSLGIVHRDVKPENIMLSSVGEATPLVKLLDFGLAKDIAPEDEDGDDAHAEHGLIFGSPAYLSPEQAAGQPADARSDLYSLGVVLFEMVCGQPPFVRGHVSEVLHDHLATPPPSPRALVPSLSPELEAVILTLLAKAPEQRLQSADEVQAALALCPEWEGSGAADPGWSSRIRLVEPSLLMGTSPSSPMNVAAATTPSSPIHVAVPPSSSSPLNVAVATTPSSPINVALGAAPPSSPITVAPGASSAPIDVREPAPAANVPEPIVAPMEGSMANLKPRRARGLAVLVVLLLAAVAGTFRMLLPRGWPTAPPPAPDPGVNTGSVRAPESHLSPAGQRHMALALDYSHKFWCSAAIIELQDGMHEAPELRTDPQTTRMMIPCLRQKNQDKTLEFLVYTLGRHARPELEAALNDDLKPDVRDGVQRALAKIAARPQ